MLGARHAVPWDLGQGSPCPYKKFILGNRNRFRIAASGPGLTSPVRKSDILLNAKKKSLNYDRKAFLISLLYNYFQKGSQIPDQAIIEDFLKRI